MRGGLFNAASIKWEGHWRVQEGNAKAMVVPRKPETSSLYIRRITVYRSIRTVLALTLFFSTFVAAVSAVGATAHAAPAAARYRVTLQNLTSGQPFSPAVVATHRPDMHMFQVGQAASDALAAIAQDGMPEPMYTMLKGADGVTEAVTVVKPVAVKGAQLNVMGMNATDEATFELIAAPGDRFSLASMLICTNDGFLGLDAVELPSEGTRTLMLTAYDAGREQNTEQSKDIVDHCSEFGAAAIPGDPNMNEDAAVATAPAQAIAAHPGIQGGGSLMAGTHRWSDPVARVTLTRMDADQPIPAMMPDTGAETPVSLYLVGLVAAMLALGLTLQARSRHAA